jgi:amino acid adenylation domain-containing protein
MRVDQFLHNSANRLAAKTALVADNVRWTYAELNERANRLAHVLIQHGVERGDRVVIFLENTADTVVSLFAVSRAGAVFSIINSTTKSDKLAYILKDCRAKALITHDRLYSVATEAARQAPTVAAMFVAGGGEAREGSHRLEPLLQAAGPTAPFAQWIDVDLAMIVYTSGSTGFPKGVMMTHQNVDHASSSIITYLENTPDDIILSVLPLSFDYGLYQALMSIKFGGTLILEKSFAFPYVILKKLIDEKATGFPLVPTIAAILLQMKDLSPANLPRLRYLTNTAAALPPAHIQRLQDLFPATRIFSMYGLTECKRCTYLPPEQLKIRPGSVGVAIPNTEAYVVDDSGQRVDAGVVGELVIRGGHVMKGYWEKPEATQKMLRPGRYPWENVLYTGDLFKTDAEGYLYFVGRKDDIIKTRGEKVSPKEVENVLYALQGVREATVIGVPDAVLGMALKAVIVPVEAGGLSEQQVIRHCAAHLEDFMVPKQVEFRTELPKTDTGKIRRSEVQAEALAGKPAAGVSN